jgi:hypothetical protein
MPRLKGLPRYRKPRSGELFGVTQAKRRFRRKYHLATLRDPRAPLKNAARRAKRWLGSYSDPAQLVRHRSGLGILLIPFCILMVPVALLRCGDRFSREQRGTSGKL